MTCKHCDCKITHVAFKLAVTTWSKEDALADKETRECSNRCQQDILMEWFCSTECVTQYLVAMH